MARVVITGANRGIGLALAAAYAARGDEVIATSRVPSDALSALPGVTRHALDVSDGASVDAFVRQMPGPVDVLINNAGISGPARPQQTLTEMDYDGWAEAFAVNSMGPLRVLQGLRARLAEAPAGKAVTITSQLGALSLDQRPKRTEVVWRVDAERGGRERGAERARTHLGTRAAARVVA